MTSQRQDQRPQRRRGDETAASVYRQAVEVFYEVGYNAATLRTIAKRVGVLAPSIYNHFPSKEELLYAIVTRTMTDLIAGTIDHVDPDDPPRQKLHAYVHHLAYFHGARRIEAGVTDTEFRHLSDPRRSRAIEMRDELQHLLEEILQDGLQTGDFQIPDVKITAYALLTMGTYVSIWYRPDGRLSLDVIANCYGDLAVSMVSAHAGPGRTTRREE